MTPRPRPSPSRAPRAARDDESPRARRPRARARGADVKRTAPARAIVKPAIAREKRLTRRRRLARPRRAIAATARATRRSNERKRIDVAARDRGRGDRGRVRPVERRGGRRAARLGRRRDDARGDGSEHKLRQRQRQIDYGKNTLGYARYRELVAKSARTIERRVDAGHSRGNVETRVRRRRCASGDDVAARVRSAGGGRRGDRSRARGSARETVRDAETRRVRAASVGRGRRGARARQSRSRSRRARRSTPSRGPPRAAARRRRRAALHVFHRART